MKDKIIQIASTGAVVLLIGTTIGKQVIDTGIATVKGVKKDILKRKIEKGLKDGSIIIVGGTVFMD